MLTATPPRPWTARGGHDQRGVIMTPEQGLLAQRQGRQALGDQGDRNADVAG